jgi:hypothetical protein
MIHTVGRGRKGESGIAATNLTSPTRAPPTNTTSSTVQSANGVPLPTSTSCCTSVIVDPAPATLCAPEEDRQPAARVPALAASAPAA